MKKEVIGICPICNDNLVVTELTCNHCNTSIHGEFELNEFNYLTKEELLLTKLFIKTQGNIKEIEKELGVSYPTVKKMLESLGSHLGLDVKVDKENRDDILSRIANKEISVEEALKLL